MNESLRTAVERILPRVQMPGQYVGGELHSIVKDPTSVRSRICFAFPDTYSLGMSHHGLQILYGMVNADDRWSCERAFCPHPDFEKELAPPSCPSLVLKTILLSPNSHLSVSPFNTKSVTPTF